MEYFRCWVFGQNAEDQLDKFSEESKNYKKYLAYKEYYELEVRYQYDTFIKNERGKLIEYELKNNELDDTKIKKVTYDEYKQFVGLKDKDRKGYFIRILPDYLKDKIVFKPKEISKTGKVSTRWYINPNSKFKQIHDKSTLLNKKGDRLIKNLKKDIDLFRMVEKEEKKEYINYDQLLYECNGKIPELPYSLEHVLYNMDFTEKEAWDFWGNLPAIKKQNELREKYYSIWEKNFNFVVSPLKLNLWRFFIDLNIKEFQEDKEACTFSKALRNVLPSAYILNGNWYVKPENLFLGDLTWEEDFLDMFDNLPDNTLVRSFLLVR